MHAALRSSRRATKVRSIRHRHRIAKGNASKRARFLVARSQRSTLRLVVCLGRRTFDRATARTLQSSPPVLSRGGLPMAATRGDADTELDSTERDGRTLCAAWFVCALCERGLYDRRRGADSAGDADLAGQVRRASIRSCVRRSDRPSRALEVRVGAARRPGSRVRAAVRRRPRRYGRHQSTGKPLGDRGCRTRRWSRRGRGTARARGSSTGLPDNPAGNRGGKERIQHDAVERVHQ